MKSILYLTIYAVCILALSCDNASGSYNRSESKIINKIEIFSNSKDKQDGLQNLLNSFDSFLELNYPNQKTNGAKIIAFLNDCESGRKFEFPCYGDYHHLHAIPFIKNWNFNNSNSEHVFNEFKKSGLNYSIFKSESSKTNYDINNIIKQFNNNTTTSLGKLIINNLEDEIIPITIESAEPMLRYEVNEHHVSKQYFDSIVNTEIEFIEALSKNEKINYSNLNLNGELLYEIINTYKDDKNFNAIYAIIAKVNSGTDDALSSLFTGGLKVIPEEVISQIHNKLVVASFIYYPIICYHVLQKNGYPPCQQLEISEAGPSMEYYLDNEVENTPEFPGGTAAFQLYLQRHIVYPSLAQENGIEDDVNVNFIVGTEGTIVSSWVENDADPFLSKEALRVINSIKFKPGKIKDVAVPVRLSTTVRFRLDNSNLQNSNAQSAAVQFMENRCRSLGLTLLDNKSIKYDGVTLYLFLSTAPYGQLCISSISELNLEIISADCGSYSVKLTEWKDL